ncbi:MAG: leucine-rich repeat protein, partial [Eubacterium sp.]|nr:leucine-rich repeat protein [Eubacterium sp.]
MAFAGCNGLSEITFPDSVNYLGVSGFEGCKGLTKVTLSSALKEIKVGIFRDCVNLTEVTISGIINSIDRYAFHNCYSLKNIYFAGTKEQWNAVNISEKNEALLNAVIHCSDGIISDDLQNVFEYRELDDGTIEITKYNGSEAEVEIPSQIDGKHVTGIGEGVFLGNKNLVKASISSGVKSIEKSAFEDCSSLEEISIPDSVEHIGEDAFKYCTKLAGIMLPDSIKEIGKMAFYNCSGLEEITIPDSVSIIGDGAFMCCSSLKEIVVPHGVERLGTVIFAECTNLTNVSISDSITIIGDSAFDKCSALKEINIPDSVSTIEHYAFYRCSSLTDVYYAGTKEQWGRINIDSASGLENERITIHFKEPDETAKDYEYNILDNNTIEITKYTGSDEAVTIPAQIDGKNVVKIAEKAFYNNENLKQAILPACLTEMEKDAFYGCPSLTALEVDAASESYTSEDGVLFNKAKTELIRCPEGKSGKYTVPSGVSSIGEYAFYNCNKLTEAVVTDGVTTIGTGAFHDCGNLKTLTIPASAVRIHKNFIVHGEAVPYSLKDVYYGGTKEQWEQIEVMGDSEGSGSVSKKLLLDSINATIHFKNDPIVLPEEPIQPEVRNPKEELESLKSNGTFQLDDFKHYLTEEQMGIMEDYLYTWLAQVNYAYQYSGSSTVKELIMKKAGIDPDGDFSSGMEQAITHISVNTKYGTKTFEITMGLGQPDSSGNLYPGYSVMHYEVLEKSGVPSDVPVSGQIVRDYYADMGAFVESVKRASEDSLHGTYQWQQLEDEMTAGVLIDKTAAEIVGNKNGSFSDGTFTIYAQPLFAYSKIVKISCPVDVHVYGMDGQEAGSIVDNKPSGGNQHVRLDVDGDTKTVYLAGDDYYLNLRGTGTGTMKYEVEEIANEEVRRNVQFLELQLKNDMLYEGYVFRPLNIDRDLYELRAIEKNGSGGEVFRADEDSYQPSFKKVQGLSLSQKNTSLESEHTIQLSASHYPLDASNPNLRWATDNESVARVDENGLVTAVGSGRATVTVSTKDGSFLKQFCVIDVAQRDDGGNSSSGNGGSGSGNNSSNGSTGGNSSGSSSSGSGNSSGSSSSGSGNSSSSSGNSSGSNTAGQDKPPVVVSLHYVLQFHANGGTNLSRRTMTLLADDSPGIMPKVQRKDYTFDGWYTKQEGGTRVAGDEPLKEAATLYARWTKAQAPAKVSALSLKSKKKGQLQASYQKVKGAAGYQVSYSGSKKFTSEKTK